MTVTLKKAGGSIAVVIPKSVARELNLSAGTSLEITTTDDAILMRRQNRRPRRALRELVARIRPASYRHRRLELADDTPVGKELW